MNILDRIERWLVKREFGEEVAEKHFPNTNGKEK